MREEYDRTGSTAYAVEYGVRALLVPALVSLFGKYNWWLPAGIAKLLRIKPAPLKPDVPRPVGVDPDAAGELRRPTEPAGEPAAAPPR